MNPHEPFVGGEVRSVPAVPDLLIALLDVAPERGSSGGDEGLFRELHNLGVNDLLGRVSRGFGLGHLWRGSRSSLVSNGIAPSQRLTKVLYGTRDTWGRTRVPIFVWFLAFFFRGR